MRPVIVAESVDYAPGLYVYRREALRTAFGEWEVVIRRQIIAVHGEAVHVGPMARAVRSPCSTAPLRFHPWGGILGNRAESTRHLLHAAGYRLAEH